MVIDQHLREERPPRVPEQHERQLGVLGADDLGELPHGVDVARQSARSEPPELGRVIAVLFHPGAPVAAVVVGVDGVAGTGERRDQGGVSPGVLSDAVQQLHHRPGGGLCGMDVVDDRDAVCIDELGHDAEYRFGTVARILLDKLATPPIAR